MKNFLAVFDGYNMSESTLNYGIELAKYSGAKLTGVFLDAFFYHNFNLKEVLKKNPDPEEIISVLEERDEKQRDLAVSRFQDACRKAEVVYAIHRDISQPLQELKYESVFADLIIINKHEIFSVAPSDDSWEFINEMLSVVNCPTILVPDQFVEIKHLQLLYDGSPSSVLAIKLFSYLFEDLSDLSVTLYTVNDPDTTESYLPENLAIRELLKRSFNKHNISIVKGNPKQVIVQSLKQAGVHTLVTLGAYQVNVISRLFRKALVDVLLSETNNPLFIAPRR